MPPYHCQCNPIELIWAQVRSSNFLQYSFSLQILKKGFFLIVILFFSVVTIYFPVTVHYINNFIQLLYDILQISAEFFLHFLILLIKNFQIKREVHSTFKLDEVEKLLDSTVDRVSIEDWKNVVEHAIKEQKKDYEKSGRRALHMEQLQIVIQLDGSDDDSSDSDDDESDTDIEDDQF